MALVLSTVSRPEYRLVAAVLGCVPHSGIMTVMSLPRFRPERQDVATDVRRRFDRGS